MYRRIRLHYIVHCKLSALQDCIRCCSVAASTRDLVLTGCYDHTARLSDTRTNSTVQSVDHGAPIEDVLVYPSGSLFITAGKRLDVHELVSAPMCSLDWVKQRPSQQPTNATSLQKSPATKPMLCHMEHVVAFDSLSGSLPIPTHTDAPI